MTTDPRLLSDDVLAECLTAISGGYCDTANALEEHIAALESRIRALEPAAAVVAGIERLRQTHSIVLWKHGAGDKSLTIHNGLFDNLAVSFAGDLADAVRAACERIDQQTPRA